MPSFAEWSKMGYNHHVICPRFVYVLFVGEEAKAYAKMGECTDNILGSGKRKKFPRDNGEGFTLRSWVQMVR
jgi:hypothetical protein